MKCPCEGCNKRTAVPSCHATCNEYKVWKEEWEELKKKMALNKSYDTYEPPKRWRR